MTSSEKRREVAEKLRHASHTDANLDVTIAIAILDTIGEVHRPIAAVVADLIDPTCEVESVEPIKAGEFNQAIGSAFHLTCGHTAWRACTDEPPVYCEECGARVVSDEGN